MMTASGWCIFQHDSEHPTGRRDSQRWERGKCDTLQGTSGRAEQSREDDTEVISRQQDYILMGDVDVCRAFYSFTALQQQ